MGTELGEPMHYGRNHHFRVNDENRKWIYIELDPTAIGQNRPIDVPLVGDLRTVVPQLTAALKTCRSRPRLTCPAGLPPSRSAWMIWPPTRRTSRPKAARCTPRPGSSKPPRRSRRTAFMCATARYRDLHVTYLQCKPHDVIWNQNFGHLGTGLPYAIGASVADGGKRPVLFTTSDSAFLFHIGDWKWPRASTCRS